MALWLEFKDALRQPEYVHVLLNPLPVYGLAVGVFALLVAWLARSRPAQGLALALILLTALSAWPVAHFGGAGYDRVFSLSNASAQSWLNWHRHLAGHAVWACYAVAALSAGALAALWKRPRAYPAAVCLCFVSALVALGLGGLAGFAGGKIRHSEFRDSPPPAWADTTPPPDEN